MGDPEKYVCEVLVDLLTMESRVESKKIELAKQTEFNLFDAFKVIDIDRVGYVTSTDLDFFMGSKRGSMAILVDNYG